MLPSLGPSCDGPEFIRTPQFDHAQAAKWDDRFELAGQGGWDHDFVFSRPHRPTKSGKPAAPLMRSFVWQASSGTR
jgi:hypothetical protein